MARRKTKQQAEAENARPSELFKIAEQHWVDARCYTHGNGVTLCWRCKKVKNYLNARRLMKDKRGLLDLRETPKGRLVLFLYADVPKDRARVLKWRNHHNIWTGATWVKYNNLLIAGPTGRRYHLAVESLRCPTELTER